eukprot:TRINITY_DN1487_c2_g1_i2.p2 TRINITY_DN1487_c2_g1~~TRINITY_DN1487_c2_g1_i2.p2  ORF type:complete len:1435 (-),score=386.19 TRINITY_DN1487_c2_g1_i2:4641-8945(-)
MNGVMVDGVIVTKRDSRVAFETTGGNESCGMIEQTVGNVYKTRIYPLHPKVKRTVVVTYFEKVDIIWNQNTVNLKYKFPCEFVNQNLSNNGEASLNVDIVPNKNIPFQNINLTTDCFGRLRLNEDSTYSCSSTTRGTLSGKLIEVEMQIKTLGTDTPELLITSRRRQSSSDNSEDDCSVSDKDQDYYGNDMNDGYYFIHISKLKEAIQSNSSQGSSGRRIKAYWDSSFSQNENIGNDAYLKVLKLICTQYPDYQIDMTFFSNRELFTKSFACNNFTIIQNFLNSVIYDGGSNLGSLKFSNEDNNNNDEFDSYKFFLLFTNGISSLTRDDEISEIQRPIYIFSCEAEVNHQLLKKLSKLSGGSYTNLTETTNYSEVIRSIGASSENNQIQYLYHTLNSKDLDIQHKFQKFFNPRLSNIPISTDRTFIISGFFPSSSIEDQDASLTLHFGINGAEKIRKTIHFHFGSNNDYEKNQQTDIINERSKLVELFWAQRTIEELINLSSSSQDDKNQMIYLSKRYKLVTPETSILVLSTLDQYVTHQVTPPESLPEMRKLFKEIIYAQKNEIKKKKEGKILNVVSLWNRRIDWWKKSTNQQTNNSYSYSDGSGEKKLNPFVFHFIDYSQELQNPNFLEYMMPQQNDPARFAEFESLSITSNTNQNIQPEVPELPVTTTNGMEVDDSLIQDTYNASKNLPMVEGEGDGGNDSDEENSRPLDDDDNKPQIESTFKSLSRNQSIIDDQGNELKVVNVMHSKTGKHGMSKTMISAINKDGKVVEMIQPSSKKVSLSLAATTSSSTSKDKDGKSKPSMKRGQKAMPEKQPSSSTSSSLSSSSSSSSSKKQKKVKQPKYTEYPVTCNTLRKGQSIMVDGEAVKITDVSTSKTGKHGSSKAFFVGYTASGKKFEKLMRSDEVLMKAEEIIDNDPFHIEELDEDYDDDDIENEEPIGGDNNVYSQVTFSEPIVSSLPLSVKLDTTDSNNFFHQLLINMPQSKDNTDESSSCSSSSYSTSSSSYSSYNSYSNNKSSSTRVTIIDWKPSSTDNPWIKKFYELLNNCSAHEINAKLCYKIYIQLRVEYFNVIAFFYDMATLFFSIYKKHTNKASSYIILNDDIVLNDDNEGLKMANLAYLVLSTISDLDFENPHLLRIIARKIDEYEAFKPESIKIFEKVLQLRPEEPQSYRDLSVAMIIYESLTKRDQRSTDSYGNNNYTSNYYSYNSIDSNTTTTTTTTKTKSSESLIKKSINVLNRIVYGIWPEMKFERYNQFEVVALMDLNDALSKFNSNQVNSYHNRDNQSTNDIQNDKNDLNDYDKVDKRLAFIPEVDIRVVLQWHDNVDVELHVVQPSGERCYSFHNTTVEGGLISTDCTGFGPEEFIIRRATAGKYSIFAKMFHTPHKNNINGSVCSLHVYTNFGRGDEMKVAQTSARLYYNKQEIHLADIEVL